MASNTIWKFPLKTTDIQVVSMPVDATILNVQVQFNEPVMYALVDATAKALERTFQIFGTGHYMPPAQSNTERVYVGSYQQYGGDLVFHVFELVPADDAKK